MIEKIKTVPQEPGCYIYYNKNKEIIYVGKAKNLKKRMSSYFNRKNNIKTQHLVSKIFDFDYFITSNEKEALILENNLIKKHTPFYNIVLKDDKKYPYIIITKGKTPKLIKTRNRKINGTYFGPFPSGSFVTSIINYLQKKTQLHKCNKIPKQECIYYHLNQCYAPCIKPENNEEIVKTEVEYLKNLLSNNLKNLIKLLKKDMEKKSQELKFEEANILKDMYIQAINLKESQAVQLQNKDSIDILNYYQDENFISLAILKLEKGKMINIHRSLIPYYDNPIEEIVSYVNEYYLSTSKPLSFATENENLQKSIEILLNIQSKKIITTEFKQLVEIAQTNAQEYYRKNIEKITKEFFIDKNKGFIELQRISNNDLHRIEMYDISHLGGDAQVGGMIVYIDGKKQNKEYRKYKIKDSKNLKDDYGSIREIIERRIIRGLESGTLPNMIVIDGGKGQVSSVLGILEKYGLEDLILLIGLSKDSKHRTKGIINKNFEEKELVKSSELFKFFYKMQEEVHRFAITFHREVKVKSLFQSELDKIPGLGPKRKQILLQKFEYIENIKTAKKNDFEKINLPKNVIDKIIEHFSLEK